MNLLEKSMPSNPEMEKTVLWVMMQYSQACTEALGMVHEEDFYQSWHKKIFRVIEEENLAGRHADIAALTSLMVAQHGEDALDPVLALADSVGVHENLPRYIEFLHEATQRRRIISMAMCALQGAHNEETPIKETIAAAEISFGEIYTASEICDKADIVAPSSLEESMLEIREKGLRNPGVDTGWQNVNTYYMPARGMLNIISGIPSHGKSSYMDALSFNLSRLHGVRWLYFSPENYPIQQHMQKLIELYNDKPFSPLMSSHSSPEENTKAIKFIDEHYGFITLPDNQNTLDALMRLVDRPAKEGRADGLIIDPWNSLSPSPAAKARNQSETREIGEALLRLRRFARRYNMFLYILAHPHKMLKPHGATKYDVPTLYNISDSAHWYNMADNGLCIYREDMEKDEIAVYIQKIKYKAHGKIGVVNLRYIKHSGRFEPMDEEKEGW